MPLIRDLLFQSSTGTQSIPWVLRRGVNGDYPTAAQITAHNINVVRKGYKPTWTRVGTTSRYTPAFNWSGIDARVNELWAAGAATVIDPHNFPGLPNGSSTWSDNPYWHDIGYHLNTEEYWRQVGAHFASWDERIAGYDILNEPNVPCRSNGTEFGPTLTSSSDAPTQTFRDQMVAAWDSLGWENAGYPALSVGDPDPRSWTGLFQRCINAIRENDTVHPIIIHSQGHGGNHAAPEGTGINQGPYANPFNNLSQMQTFVDPANNLVYQWHFYQPREFAANATGSYPGTFGGVYWDASRIATTWQPVRDWQLSHGSPPIYIGEVGPKPRTNGTTDPLPGADTYERDLLNVLEGFGWSWGRHVYASGGIYDAALNPALLAVLDEFWARNV